MGGDAPDIEAHQRSAGLRVHPHAGQVEQLLTHGCAQGDGLLVHLRAVGERKAHSSVQPGDARQVLRAAFQAVGHHAGLEHALGHGTRASLAQWGERHTGRHPQRAGSVRAK